MKNLFTRILRLHDTGQFCNLQNHRATSQQQSLCPEAATLNLRGEAVLSLAERLEAAGPAAPLDRHGVGGGD